MTVARVPKNGGPNRRASDVRRHLDTIGHLPSRNICRLIIRTRAADFDVVTFSETCKSCQARPKRTQTYNCNNEASEPINRPRLLHCGKESKVYAYESAKVLWIQTERQTSLVTTIATSPDFAANCGASGQSGQSRYKLHFTNPTQRITLAKGNIQLKKAFEVATLC